MYVLDRLLVSTVLFFTGLFVRQELGKLVRLFIQQVA